MKPFSIKDRLKSFVYAWNGIVSLIKSEHNARIHLLALIIVLPLGFYLDLSKWEWVAIAIVSGMVIITEAINTAIEKLADIVDPKWNDRIGEVKDYAAGATLIAAVVSVIVAALIFVPKTL